MTRDLTGRRFLITGASSGIGRGVAEEAAQRGGRLVIAARSTDKLEQLAETLRQRHAEVISVTTDITSDVDRKGLLHIVTDQLGGLDVLVNNAGIASFGHFANSSEAILRQIMEVNFFAPAELMRLAIPVLMQGRQPAIVNVASMCGRRGMPAWPEYSASKFALCGLTEALRAEMARFDIAVLLIVPGLTRSNLSRHLLRYDGRMKIDFDGGMEPAQVAAAILNALEKNRSETVVGGEAKMILYLNRFFPGLVDRLIQRKVRKLYAESDAP